ncbi:tyrosine-type recombinase/integrase [Microbispora siamensis]
MDDRIPRRDLRTARGLGQDGPSALDDYRSKTRHWIIPLLGRHRLDRLAPEHLDKAYATMLEQGRSSSTVLKVHRILSRALKIAVRRNKATRNVATLVDAPVAADPDLEPLTRNEARKILEAAKSRRNAARWSVALALGIRQGEALGLRWSFVDLETGVIKAWYHAQRSPWKHGCDDPHDCGKKWHRWPCKPRCRVHKHDPACPQDCTKRGHVCPTRTCAKDCAGHAGRAEAGELWEDHDLLFPTRRGRPMERSEDYKMWKALLRQAGGREARLHDARHTAGTLLVEQGVHIRVVQEILGHARVTTTERYTHIASPQVKDASERMGAALWGED